jgi:hypothetical protein
MGIDRSRSERAPAEPRPTASEETCSGCHSTDYSTRGSAALRRGVFGLIKILQELTMMDEDITKQQWKPKQGNQLLLFGMVRFQTRTK